MSVPTWAKGLKQVGLYYEGYVEDIDLIRQQQLCHRLESEDQEVIPILQKKQSVLECTAPTGFRSMER